MTKDEHYLDPVRAMASIRINYLENTPKEEPAPGSRAWCGLKLDRLAPFLAKYRFLTNDQEFDALLERDLPAYVRLRLLDDRKTLTLALRDTADALAVNFDGYTREVRYTDRVLRFPAIFERNCMYLHPIPTIRTPEPDLLYSTATGDPGRLQYFPMNAVRWLTPPRDIAALVTDTSSSRFTAELFHFGPAPRPMRAELYLLAPGDYVMTVKDLGSSDALRIDSKPLRVTTSRTGIGFELPARTPCRLEIRRAGEAR
jgi:hypothetical protein